MDPAVGQRHATGALDRVAQRNRPAVLEQRDRRRGSLRDVLGEVPDLVLEERAVLRGAGPGERASLRALFSFRAEAEEGSSQAGPNSVFSFPMQDLITS